MLRNKERRENLCCELSPWYVRNPDFIDREKQYISLEQSDSQQVQRIGGTTYIKHHHKIAYFQF